jgi:PAS domain S-box-containing protein
MVYMSFRLDSARLFSHPRWPLFFFLGINILSLLFTAIMNIINSLIWWGRIDPDLILIGCVDSLVVSSLITPGAIYLIRHAFNLEEMNRKLLKEISEKTMAETALRESEEKYKFLAEKMADIVWTMDLNLRTTYVSASVENVLGFTVTERKSMTVEEMFPTISLQRVWAKFQEELEQDPLNSDPERSVVLEVEAYRKDGSTIWLENTMKIMRDSHGSIIGIYGVSRDCSDRKGVEEALRSEKEKFKALSEDVPFGMLMIDQNDNFQYINPKLKELLGYDLEDVPNGKIWFEKAFPDHEYRHEVISLWKSDLEKSKPGVKRNRTFTVTCKDGTEKTINFIPVQLLTGENLMTLEDITERCRAEEEKRQLEERLQRSEKMEALGTLAGGVAHDLNNVLGVMVGYSELLLYEADQSSQIRPRLESILSGSQRAAAIVQDLLTLARRGVASRKVVNLNQIVAECRNSPEFEKLSSYHSSVIIRTLLEPDLLNITGSSIHLVKMLFNLISNASEAMPEGGVLTITTSNQYLDKPIQGYDEVREGDYVVLSVSDTGEGISTADLKHIFEPFYTKKVMGRSGTGLGLAVVWGTVKDHFGYINVKSKEGKGSTFTMYFPVTREATSAEALPLSISEYSGKGESILVIDDIKAQRDLAKEILQKLYYRVSDVAGGEEAVTYLKEHEVDLLVLDMIMDPGMDGLDTYKKILEIHPRQKAIIVSGFSESERVHAAQALGAGAYVKKPYVMEKLGLAVKKALERKP